MRVLLITVVLVTQCFGALSEDFIAGFETGVYLRTDDKAFRDYNCPQPEVNDKLGRQIQGLITPMKLMGSMMRDKVENVDEIVNAISVFL